LGGNYLIIGQASYQRSERINMKENELRIIEVKKNEAKLYISRGENKKGNPILMPSEFTARKGDQFALPDYKVTKADGGRKVHFIGNLGDPLYIDKEDVSNLHNGVKVYTVKKDDTLSSIATEFYKNGDEEHTMKLFEANRHVIEDADVIKIDQMLIIPKL
jgi:nucleoid-associated protein YgaU